MAPGGSGIIDRIDPLNSIGSLFPYATLILGAEAMQLDGAIDARKAMMPDPRSNLGTALARSAGGHPGRSVFCVPRPLQRRNATAKEDADR